MSARTHPRQSYAVGIICALDVEKAAVEATLTEEHGRVEKAAGDDNTYAFGKIGAHSVVMACLPQMDSTVKSYSGPISRMH
jgi:hypothetical protein